MSAQLSLTAQPVACPVWGAAQARWVRDERRAREAEEFAAMVIELAKERDFWEYVSTREVVAHLIEIGPVTRDNALVGGVSYDYGEAPRWWRRTAARLCDAARRGLIERMRGEGATYWGKPFTSPASGPCPVIEAAGEP